MQRSEFKERDDIFISEYEEPLINFMKSDEEFLHLEPMNSYYRRLVHHLAKDFNLKTMSEGEGTERHVVLTKTMKSQTPEKLRNQRPIVWNFGNQEFLVDPLQEEVEIYLGKDGTVGLYNGSAKIPYKYSCF